MIYTKFKSLHQVQVAGSQPCAGWVKMLDVYHVILKFEVNKDSVIIQRDKLSSYMRLITVPSVPS